jgi:hypothetical protein
MANPATKKRGGNPDVQHKPEGQKPKDAMERKLEQGLEESMTGSDPVSVTQPPKTKSVSHRHIRSERGARIFRLELFLEFALANLGKLLPRLCHIFQLLTVCVGGRSGQCSAL